MSPELKFWLAENELHGTHESHGWIFQRSELTTVQNDKKVSKQFLVKFRDAEVNNYAEDFVHTSELDRSEIDLSPKRSECERSNVNWDRSKIDLNECEHFLKANWDRSQIDPT